MAINHPMMAEVAEEVHRGVIGVEEVVVHREVIVVAEEEVALEVVVVMAEVVIGPQ